MNILLHSKLATVLQISLRFSWSGSHAKVPGKSINQFHPAINHVDEIGIEISVSPDE